MSVTEEIKSRLDIVDIVSETVSLRKSGRNYAGFCPFHSNTRTPAFYVFPETQTWRCFGACAEGGDLFSYVMKKEGWDFREALEQMARRAGVTLEDRRPQDKAQVAAEQKQTDLLSAAADYFHMLLMHAPEADHARHYVRERELTDETLAEFRLGFALNGWDKCRTHFNEQGYDDQDLLDAGLLTENEERGTRYDRFRNRLMIPIRDVNGRVVGFGARTLEKDGIPKYLNSPQTELFDKSSLLFGLDTAKRHIREARQVVIVEGYMDVMQGWQHGFRNMVAQMGTALTERQLQLLKRYTKRFVLALDADAAGAKATLRGLQVARETLDHDVEVRFDAQGLVRHEARLQADIQVVTLPEGNDPDKIIRTQPELWPQLLAKSQPVVAYVIEVLTRDLDMGDAKGKTAVAQQVIPLIKDIQDPVERDHYWQQLARTLRIDERALRQVRIESKPRQRQQPRPPQRGAIGEPPPPTLDMPPEPDMFWPEEAQPVVKKRLRVRPSDKYHREAYFLRQCMKYPEMVRRVNQLLQRMEQGVVSAQDFALQEDRLIFQQIMQIAIDAAFVAGEDLCDSLDDDVLQSRLQVLRTLIPEPPASLDKLPDKLALSVLQWRQDSLEGRVQEIKLLVQEAAYKAVDEPGSDVLHLYQQQASELARSKVLITRAINSMSAVQRRRAADGGGYGRLQK
ncbi:MAG: DNA primase [Ardenticatenaceae bacterium]|nr:DNA primase [Ardenticatenaceae bacterium]MCB8989771.1 DNA primase [Ardenticatenaceae bacterium]MCB9002770.1 DNA primase [Ardenticatenaceae bacterium]